MDTNWEKWAAVGQIAGAIGTFLAVLTSLFLARQSVRPKLSIDAGIRLIITPGLEGPFPKLVVISIRNAGMRDVHVDQISWRVGRWPLKHPKWLNRGFAVQMFGTVPESHNPPFALPQGKRAAAMLNFDQTIKNIEDRRGESPLYAKRWPILGVRRAPIFVSVHLSSGEMISARVEKDLEKELFEAELIKFRPS